LTIKSLKVALFVLLDILFVFLKMKGPPPQDTDVIMGPYEAKIRALLWRKNPSILHKVDTMLERYRGSEQILYDELCQQYLSPAGNIGSPSTLLSASYEYGQTPVDEYGHTPVVGASTGAAVVCAIQGRGTELTRTMSFTHKSTQVAAIESILKQHEPRMLHLLGTMLTEYEGREDELLREVRLEYGVQADGATSIMSSCNADRRQRTIDDGYASTPIAKVGHDSSSAVYNVSTGHSPFSSTTPEHTSNSSRLQTPHLIDNLLHNDKNGEMQPNTRRLSNSSNGDGGTLRHSQSGGKKSVDYTVRNRERDLAAEQARLEVQRGIQARINARWGAPK